MEPDPVSTFLAAVVAGSGVPPGLYCTDAVLDATVPMWRFELHGPGAISAQLSSWYDVPATLTELVRSPLPSGEVLRFTQDAGGPDGPWAAHQVHVLEISGDCITRHEVWCGGRWPAALLAEIETGLQSPRAAS